MQIFAEVSFFFNHLITGVLLGTSVSLVTGPIAGSHIVSRSYCKQSHRNRFLLVSFCPLTNAQTGRAIAQSVSRWLPSAAARVWSRVGSCGICAEQSVTGAGFLRVLWFPLPIRIPPICFTIIIIYHCFLNTQASQHYSGHDKNWYT
jgi:hypothetical protein